MYGIVCDVCYKQMQSECWMPCHLPRIWVFCLLQDLERVFPVLTLHFTYIRKDRQKRKYVVLDDCPEQCLQVGVVGGGDGDGEGGSSSGRCWILQEQTLCSVSTHTSAVL